MKKLLILCGVVIALALGGYYYAKYCLNQWVRDHGFEVKIGKIETHFQGVNRVDLSFKEVAVENLNTQSNFHKLKSSNVTLYLPLLPHFSPFQYDLRYKIEGLQVNRHSEPYLDIESAQGEVNYKEGLYKVPHLTLDKVKFGLDVAESLRRKPYIGHLFLNKVNIEGRYFEPENKVNFTLEIPLSKDLPESQSYSLEAKGDFTLIPTYFEDYLRPNSTIVPLKGTAKFTINNFSNFLNQLHQIKAISLLEENIGSILGFPIPKINFITNQIKEFMTNAVTLELKVSPKASFIGPIQVYP